MVYPIQATTTATSAAITTGPGMLHGATITAAGDTATLIVYDNTAGSGTVIVKLSAVAHTSAVVTFPAPVVFGTGCYAVVTGTTPSATVAFS
jgi:hypothetical protein